MSSSFTPNQFGSMATTVSVVLVDIYSLFGHSNIMCLFCLFTGGVTSASRSP